MPYKSEYVGTWKVEMFDTCCAAPGDFCLACLCPWCTAYQHRTYMLDSWNRPYYCCGGLFPCCCLANDCPRECLCLEVCFCLSCAVSGNRMMVQQQYQLMNTCCDECILWSTCMLSWVLCILQAVGVPVNQELRNCADLIYCTVLGCMQTQHGIQLGLIQFGDMQPAPSQQSMKA